MLAKERQKIETNIKKLSDGVVKLESTAAGVSELEEFIKVKAVEVEAKKAEVDMIPKLEEKARPARRPQRRTSSRSRDEEETEVMAMK